MKETAQAYHRERLGNCAQSVAHAWDTNNQGGQGSAARFAGCGGGKAPGGLCGALHASCELAGAAAAEAIKHGFAEKSGGPLTCKEIRATRKLSCNECVGLAAELLGKYGMSTAD